MFKKILFSIASILISQISFAASLTPTKAPDKAVAGTVIELKSDQVPTYCNFKEQIVNLGYDKKDNIIMACVKKD